MSLMQSQITSDCNLEGKQPSGTKCERDGRKECILSGNSFKFLQLANSSGVKTGAGNPLLGNGTNLGHSQIFKEWREGRSLRGLSCAQSDSRSGQLPIEREFNLGNKSSEMHLREAQPLILISPKSVGE